jgi:ABC-2 type transporter
MYQVGLGGRMSFGNFCIYAFILFTFATTVNQQIALFSSFASEAKLQLYAAIFLFFNILFSGFIIPVLSIPKFWLFAYYWNPFQWAYTAFLVNEAYSGRYADPQEILKTTGVVTPNGNVLGWDWIWWSVLYLWVYFGLCSLLTVFGLCIASRGRMARAGGRKSSRSNEDSVQERTEASNYDLEDTFQPVTLSFQGLSYEVKASTSNERLKLLNNISGTYPARIECLLMEIDSRPRLLCSLPP